MYLLAQAQYFLAMQAFFCTNSSLLCCGPSRLIISLGFPYEMLTLNAILSATPMTALKELPILNFLGKIVI
jgi:hypothetical protein